MVERLYSLARQLKRRLFPSQSRSGRKRGKEEAFLQRLLNDLVSNPDTGQRVERVLALEQDDPRLAHVVAEEERALPGNPTFRKSGYYRTMLTRYALGMHYSKGKHVLDSCSGLGWGSYLVDAVARQVIAIDIDPPTVTLARSLWPGGVTQYITGSVLQLPVESDSMDTVLAMESIEHFGIEDISRYLDELRRVLKAGGRLVGSSSFPETRQQASALCQKNPYHLHICTRSELVALLRHRFRQHHVYENRLFFWAIK